MLEAFKKRWNAALRLSVAVILACTGIFLPIDSSHASERDELQSEQFEVEPMTQEKIDEANDAYNDVSARLTFVTMSDTEFGSNTADENGRYQSTTYEAKNGMIKRIAEWAERKNFDIQAVMDNGDVIGANEAEYYDHLAGNDTKAGDWYRALEQSFSENFGDAYIMLAQGNHDIADLMGDVLDEKHADDEKWLYPNDDTGNVSNIHVEINGYDFITLDYNGATVFGYGGQQSGYQDFLQQTLDEISSEPDYDPAKPIFIQVHSGYAGTSLGGPFHGTYDTVGQDLQDILADYPQAFVGSAHTHFSVEPETSIYQKDFTFFENGSMNYIYQDVPGNFLGGGYFDGDQGDPEAGLNECTCNFISVLEDGSTVIRRFDATHQRWIGMPWVVDTTQGKAGFSYTDDKRSTVAPWWGEGAKVTFADTTETETVIGFDQALDDELVNYYEVTVTDASGNPVAFKAQQVPDYGDANTKSISGTFLAYSRWYMNPDTMGFKLSGLKPATYYNVKVVAYDDFRNASEPLEQTFRTAGELVFPELPDFELPESIEEGQYFAMDFEGSLNDAISGVVGTSVGDVTYVDSYRSDANQAVKIASGAGSYVDLGKLDQWDLGTDGDITINFWINVESCGGYGSILSNKNWSNWWRKGINIAPESTDTSKIEFTLGDDVSGGGAYCTGVVDNYVGAWHMMSVSIDRESQVARTYFDGELAKETDISHVGDMTSGLDMYLGVDASKSYGSTAFAMDDLDMWNRALSEGEIASLYGVGDISGVREAINDGISYADDLLADMKVQQDNGRVYDAALTEALEEAMEGAASVDDAGARDAFNALKDAVDAFESQTVRYKVSAVGVNGVVGAKGLDCDQAAEAGANVTFALAPDEGYQIEGSDIEVTSGMEYELVGSQLVVKDVSGPVDVRVTFAEIVDEGDGTGNGDGTGDGDGAGDGDGSAGGNGSDGGSGAGTDSDMGNGPDAGDGNGAGTGSDDENRDDQGASDGQDDGISVHPRTSDGTLQVMLALFGLIAAACVGLVVAWRKLRVR